MSPALARVVEAGGLATVLLLPLWFNPFARVPFEPAKIALFLALTAMMSLAWVGWRMGSRGRLSQTQPDGGRTESDGARNGSRLAQLAIAYAAIVLIATVFSIDPGLSWRGKADNPRGALTILAGVLFFLLLVDVLRRPSQVARLVKQLILASVPVIVYGLAQALGLDPLQWVSDSVSPVHATLGRSNFLGAYLAMAAPWTLACALAHQEPAQRRRFLAVLALQTACLALTLARGAWIGLTVGCVGLLAALAMGWRERRLWLAAGIALAIGGAVLAAMTFVRLPGGQQQAQAAGLSYPQLRAESTLRRGIIWQNALALAPDRWLLGYGPATFEQVFSAAYPPGTLYQGTDVVVDDPHNLLLERQLATGAAGLVAYAAVVAAFFWTGRAAWRRGPSRWGQAMAAAAAASVAAYLVQAQFNPDVVVLTMLFWLALAVMVALARL